MYYSICCFDSSGREIWSGPKREIPSLPAGRCVLQDGEVYRLRGGNILAVTVTKAEGEGVWVDIASANSSERLVLRDKVRLHNYSTMFTIQTSDGEGRIVFSPEGEELGLFESIVAKKEEQTIFGVTKGGGKIVIVKNDQVVL